MVDLPAATEVAVTVIPTPSDEVVSDPFEYALAEDLFGNDAAADIALSDDCLSDDLFQSPVEAISAGDADEDDGEGPFATNVEPPSDDTPAEFRLLATPSTPTHPMHRYQKFVPSPDGRPRHCSQRWLLLYDGRGDNTVAKPKVYAVLDSYLQSVEWMVETRHNGSNDVMPYEVTWKTQMSVKEGHEFAQKIQLGAAFKGLSISTEWESKTFKETETTKSRTEKMSVQIPPGRTLFFYYRRWNFISRTWFVNEWDGQMAGRFRIANDRGQEIVRVTQHSILSSDWAAMLREIKGTGLTKIAPVKTRPVQDLRKWTHYFPDAVQKGLGRVGINPAHG